MAPLLPAIFVLGLFFIQSNRNRHAWMILLPVVASAGIFYLPIRGFSAFSGGGSPFSINSQLLGLAAVWLLGDVLARLGRFKALVVAVLIMVAFALAVALMQGVTVSAFPYIALFSITPVLVLVLAAFWCRRRYSNARYIGMLICACLLVVFAIGSIASVVLMISMRSFFMVQMLVSLLIGIPIFAGVAGVLFFVGLLPFVLLSFYNDFYRRRFITVLGLGDDRGPVERSIDPT